MFYYKLVNVRQENGVYDYKELDIDLFYKGYQVYPFNMRENNMCLVASSENIPSNGDLEQLIEKEYFQLKNMIEEENNTIVSKQEYKTQEERIEKLEDDITVLQNSLVEEQYNELMKGVK
ncbi:TPA: hypothetical protein ACXDAY_004161 [Clostridium botulinum]|uniref:Uncharacterized protein n=1 Tax=Clostridium sporogenes TaxID=1509 RepID=A0AAE4FP56_CLOSG|nr:MULTISPECIES: chain A, Sc Smc1hd:Scc1-C complex, Atpgs [Clostridium]EPS56716.1 chain A, Sc Smc1hd:Scc1-C complex, Atpgs [Clostridium botulinum Af84]MBN3351697.1 hypothetical protein [Clostridium botulinum]MBN3360485.1 hypothetical protein [Clostridium botulinum]MBN3405743.1 hypothetical protein [Clostridium botulinum]MDS1005388.1 hypothetical protein [Clostridium sporogenes]